MIVQRFRSFRLFRRRFCSRFRLFRRRFCSRFRLFRRRFCSRFRSFRRRFCSRFRLFRLFRRFKGWRHFQAFFYSIRLSVFLSALDNPLSGCFPCPFSCRGKAVACLLSGAYRGENARGLKYCGEERPSGPFFSFSLAAVLFGYSFASLGLSLAVLGVWAPQAARRTYTTRNFTT